MEKTNHSLLNWINRRFPFSQMWREQVSEYYAPKNLNFWYYFGSLALFVFASQIVTGIWLTMFYTPSTEQAFASVEYIMRDVNYGWLIRYLHSTGASAFFIVIYLHIFRAFLYGSYKSPRELLWLFGMVIFALLLVEAFFGYLLPWGQMSYWGAQVITSLFSAIPYIGDSLTLWVRGDYNIADATLHRFFALHITAVPLLMIFLVWSHVVALHQVGSNNPDGIDINEEQDKLRGFKSKIPFHPYFTVKDGVGLVVFLILFSAIVFFYPDFGGYFLEHDNYVPADPLVTPEHIAPVWYMTPFYAILRAVPNKLMGVIAMAAAIAILFALPWLDRSPVRSIRYRGLFSKVALALFAISFISLGYLGTVPVTGLRLFLARTFSIIYFAYFILMPFYSYFEKTKPTPEVISLK